MSQDRVTIQRDFAEVELDCFRQNMKCGIDSLKELARNLDGGSEVSEDIDRQEMLYRSEIDSKKKQCKDAFLETANIMSYMLNRQDKFEYPQESIKRKIVKYLKKEGILVEDIFYRINLQGHKSINIKMQTLDSHYIAAENVAQMISLILKESYVVDVASPLYIKDAMDTFTFSKEGRYVLITGVAKAIQENELVSGDNYSVFDEGSGRSILTLSDGTGSGERAGMDSEKVLDLMEKMIETGYDIPVITEMINFIYCVKDEECCHPTIDACDVDLENGKCVFYKYGGSTSYIVKENKIERVECRSFPLGVFEDAKVNSIECELKGGDYILLLTDGVEEALSDGVENVVRRIGNVSPKEMAERIIQKAIAAQGGHIYDDMTVLVASLWKKNGIA